MIQFFFFCRYKTIKMIKSYLLIACISMLIFAVSLQNPVINKNQLGSILEASLNDEYGVKATNWLLNTQIKTGKVQIDNKLSTNDQVVLAQYTIAGIDKIWYQVVNGFKYFLEFRLNQTYDNSNDTSIFTCHATILCSVVMRPTIEFSNSSNHSTSYDCDYRLMNFSCQE
jgi:hypothetical protein